MGEQQVYVKPAINPDPEAGGKPYYTWHPSAFRKAIPADGAWVPVDIFTLRYIRDGLWIKSTPPKAASSLSKHAD